MNGSMMFSMLLHEMMYNTGRRRSVGTMPESEHCRICGETTYNIDRFCSGNCKKAYTNNSLKNEIRKNSRYGLVNGRWMMRKSADFKPKYRVYLDKQFVGYVEESLELNRIMKSKLNAE